MPHATLKKYIIGYALSLATTLAAFTLVWWHLSMHHAYPSHEIILPAILALALAQFIVQVVCFLHVGSGAGKGWNVAVFSLALIVVGVLCGGTLWIMANLSSNNPLPFTQNQINPQAEQD